MINIRLQRCLLIFSMVLLTAGTGRGQEVWDFEFTGVDNPTTQGWIQAGSNHHQYNSRLGDGNPVGGTPGWMIASGNPGNYWSRADAVNITQAGGWTFEFTAATHPGIPAGQNYQSEWLRLMDGQARISFGVHPSNGTVTLWDRYWNVPADTKPLVLYDGSPTGLERTYRVRRLAGSSTVELYVDNDFSSPYAQITPTTVGGGAGVQGIQVVGDSFLEGNVAGWRYRAGGMIPGQEIWDFEYTGLGNPGPHFPQSVGINSSTYNLDDKFTNGDVFAGWLTAGGNPGGLLARDFTTNTLAGGWTLEWTMQAHPTGPLPATDVVRFGDDASLINVRYQDGQVQLFGALGSSSSPLALDIRQAHTYRLVRQGGQSSVQLYVGYSDIPALSFVPDAASSGLNRLAVAPSEFEAAWDFIRYHSGATLPVAPAPSPPGLYIPTQVQHGANGRTYTVNPAINNHAVLPDQQRLPDLWQQGDTIRIMAARGEYEPATFVLNTDTPLQAVNVEIGPLTGAAGTLPANTLDVRVVQPYFKRVTNWPAEMPWVLTHDPGLFTIVDEPPPWAQNLPPGALDSHHGYTKTNLLTRAAIDTDTLQPADVDARQQFWITAHIPENAKPGTYTAPVRVVSANGQPMELTLEVRVPNFELLAPQFEYSVYYPAFLEGTFAPSSPYAQLTETQYVNEMKNMVAHGLTNPVFYKGVELHPDGSLDYSHLERQIALREQAGMGYQNKPLYVPDNPLLIVQRDLAPEEYARNVNYASQIVSWAESNGYGDVFFMANDEASGAALAAERHSFQSIHEGGGKVWVAVINSGYYDVVGDLLDVPVLQHPGHVLWDQAAERITAGEFLLNPKAMERFADVALLLTPDIQAAIDAAHANGQKVFSYMDPVGGLSLPESHRRFRGLGLLLAGLDGSMTWAYTHIHGNNVNFADFDPLTQVLTDMISNLVFRGEEAPFDTLGWEGFREGVDDARYLATLLAAMEQARLSGTHLNLVLETEQWLGGLSYETDLDAMRQEIAWRIEVLAPLPEPALLLGDFNLDGIISGLDIQGFIDAFTNEEAYKSTHGLSPADFLAIADINMDSFFSGLDINPFVDLLTSGGVSQSQLAAYGLPEPAAGAVLCLLLTGVMARRPRSAPHPSRDRTDNSIQLPLEAAS